MNRSRRLTFISNVRHVSHQLEAIRSFDCSCVCVLPSRVRAEASRYSEHFEMHDIGIGQYWPYFFIKLGIQRPSWAVRVEHRLQALAIRRYLRQDVVHVVEGLWGASHRSKQEGQYLIVERRNLHHQVFERFYPFVQDFPPTAFDEDPIADYLEREYSEADLIIVYSQAAVKSFIDRGHPMEKMRVVPLPYEPSREQMKSYEDLPRRALFVGRCTADKGVDIAVSAVTSAPRWTLTVAGSASREVRDWLSTHDCVNYAGVLPNDEVLKLMRSHDLLVLPSVESYGLVALEAIACGLPVVVSNDTGAAGMLTNYCPESVVERTTEAVGDFLAAFGCLDAQKQRQLAARQQRILSLVSPATAKAAQESVYAEVGLRKSDVRG